MFRNTDTNEVEVNNANISKNDYTLLQIKKNNFIDKSNQSWIEHESYTHTNGNKHTYIYIYRKRERGDKTRRCARHALWRKHQAENMSTLPRPSIPSTEEKWN